MSQGPAFLSSDGDGHWFIVPVAFKSEWSRWQDIPDDDERKWTPPSYATPVNGSPSQVVFVEWRLI